MEFDQMPPIVQRAFSFAVQGWDIASAWLLSPAAWSQFILLLIAYYGAVYVAKKTADHLSYLDPARRVKNYYNTNTLVCINVPPFVDAAVGLYVHRDR